MTPAADLPDDPETLKAMLLALCRENEALKAVNADAEARMERLTALLKALERARHGRRSETLDPEQHAFAFEAIETGVAAIEASLEGANPARARTPHARARRCVSLGPAVERLTTSAPRARARRCLAFGAEAMMGKAERAPRLRKALPAAFQRARCVAASAPRARARARARRCRPICRASRSWSSPKRRRAPAARTRGSGSARTCRSGSTWCRRRSR